MVETYINPSWTMVLIIGNSTYNVEEYKDLDTPKNDA